MNGEDNLDARIAAQAERLAAKGEAPVITGAPAPVAEQPAVVAQLGAALLSNGHANVNLPANREHFMTLLNVLVAAAIDESARAGHQRGAEEAAKAIAANPRLGPLMWLRQRFKAAPRQEAK